MDGKEKSKQVSIYPYIDQDFEKLIELSKTTYSGREISDANYLNWEYKLNPDGKAIISVAEENNKIVSQYLVLPRTFSIGNKTLAGSLSVNTLTHPDYRGQGLFTKLSKETFKNCSEKDIQFTIGFPNRNSLPVIEKNKIFKTAGYLPLLVKVLNPASSVVRYISSPRNKTGEEIELKFSDANTSIDNIYPFNFSADSDKYEDFLNNFNREKENKTLRSLRFLKWRYSEIPFRKYIILKIETDNKIRAIAVFRARYIFGMRCGILVDLISLNNDISIGRLLKFISKNAIENKLDLIIAMVPVKSPEYKLLRSESYFAIPQFLLPQKLSFIVQSHSQSCPAEVKDFKKWFLTFGDYDIF